MQAAGARLSGVWLQDWVGKRVTGFGEQLWWTWQLNRATYPGWEQMVKDFNDQGIRVMTYVNPFVIDEDEVNGQPIRNFYAEGARKGYLVKNQKGGDPYVVQTVGFPTGLVDLTNPKARDWFAGIIAEQVLGVGASGFMADFGEYLPMDARLANGTPRTQHNRWPQLWARTVRDACRRGGVPDCVAFFRSSYLGSPRNVPLMWAGDQMVNYAEEDGMRNAVLGMLAGGVSGAPLWHSDIGGYTSVNAAVTNFVRPPQLNARWAEMQAFGVVMRTHETNRPRLNQQVYDTAETRAQFARASRIYAALAEYRAGVIQEGVQRGIPAMRHGWQVHPGTRAAAADLQFFLGDHLLVAPVYADGATTADVTFPPGQWRHVLTGEVFDGDRSARVPAPLGTPAAFVQVGDPVGDGIVASLRAAGL
jgi:alpha-glucosidase